MEMIQLTPILICRQKVKMGHKLNSAYRNFTRKATTKTKLWNGWKTVFYESIYISTIENRSSDSRERKKIPHCISGSLILFFAAFSWNSISREKFLIAYNLCAQSICLGWFFVCVCVLPLAGHNLHIKPHKNFSLPFW